MSHSSAVQYAMYTVVARLRESLSSRSEESTHMSRKASAAGSSNLAQNRSYMRRCKLRLARRSTLKASPLHGTSQLHVSSLRWVQELHLMSSADLRTARVSPPRWSQKPMNFACLQWRKSDVPSRIVRTSHNVSLLRRAKSPLPHSYQQRIRLPFRQAHIQDLAVVTYAVLEASARPCSRKRRSDTSS